MSKPSLYQITSDEVSPVTDLLKAVVEVNWHTANARERQWKITLSVDQDTGDLGVEVARLDEWPNEADQELPE